MVDGRLVGIDTSARGRQTMDSTLKALRGRRITDITIYLAGDSTAMATYGSRASVGLVIIQTER
jgi:hypothetical protein